MSRNVKQLLRYKMKSGNVIFHTLRNCVVRESSDETFALQFTMNAKINITQLNDSPFFPWSRLAMINSNPTASAPTVSPNPRRLERTTICDNKRFTVFSGSMKECTMLLTAGSLCKCYTPLSENTGLSGRTLCIEQRSKEVGCEHLILGRVFSRPYTMEPNW